DLQRRSEEVLAAEQAHAEELAGRATSLRDLIASLEAEIDAVRLAEEERRKAAEEIAAAARETERTPAPETSRMAEPVPFDRMIGKAPLPVAGRFTARFGATDETGSRIMGDMVAT